MWQVLKLRLNTLKRLVSKGPLIVPTLTSIAGVAMGAILSYKYAKLSLKGNATVKQAKIEWSKNIRDNAQGAPTIDKYIAQGLGRTAQKTVPYTPQSYQWCGAFVAYCWVLQGLDKYIAAHEFGSTYRLKEFGTYGNGYKVTHPDGSVELLEEYHARKHALRKMVIFGDKDTGTNFPVQPGDILVVGGAKKYGTHITLVESFDGRDFTTIEGNAYGLLANGKEREGVIKRVRQFGGNTSETGYARRLYRLSPLDLNNKLEIN